MVNGEVDLCAHALDLALERANALFQLLDRHRVEILLRELHQRIAGLAREELLEVHAGENPPKRRLLSTKGTCACAISSLERGAMSTLPQTMTAIDPAEAGGPEVLQPVE